MDAENTVTMAPAPSDGWGRCVVALQRADCRFEAAVRGAEPGPARHGVLMTAARQRERDRERAWSAFRGHQGDAGLSLL
jgi:hypothetical protein